MKLHSMLWYYKAYEESNYFQIYTKTVDAIKFYQNKGEFIKATYLTPMLPFYTPWKSLVSGVFRGFKVGILARNGLTIKN